MLAVSGVIILKPKLGQTKGKLRTRSIQLPALDLMAESGRRLKRTLKVCSTPRIEKNFCQP